MKNRNNCSAKEAALNTKGFRQAFKRPVIAFTLMTTVFASCLAAPMAYARTPSTLPLREIQEAEEESQLQKEQEIEVFDPLNEHMRAYLDNSDYTAAVQDRSIIEVYSPLGTAYRKPIPYEIETDRDSYLYFYNLTEDQEVYQTVYLKDNVFYVYNLVPERDYLWVLYDMDGNEFDRGYVRPMGVPRIIYTESVHNVRDMGGWAANGGTVRYGLMYRGGSVDGALPVDQVILKKLGIKLELDLRTNEEAWLHTKAFGDAPAGENSIIPHSDYIRQGITGYKYGIKLDGNTKDVAVNALKRMMDSVIKGNPVYVHCAAGADRTGTICFLIEGLLGVSHEDMDRDYELTSFSFVDHDRYRNSGEYMPMVEYMNSLPGDTWEDKFAYWFESVGFDADYLNKFRQAAINGEPAPVREFPELAEENSEEG